MEANNVEKRFNDWFTVSYDRLRNLVGRYGTLDEDNFHDTYLFVRKQVLNRPSRSTVGDNLIFRIGTRISDREPVT